MFLMWREPGVRVAQALVLCMGGVKPGAGAEGEPGRWDDGLWLLGSHVLTLVRLFQQLFLAVLADHHDLHTVGLRIHRSLIQQKK